MMYVTYLHSFSETDPAFSSKAAREVEAIKDRSWLPAREEPRSSITWKKVLVERGLLGARRGSHDCHATLHLCRRTLYSSIHQHRHLDDGLLFYVGNGRALYISRNAGIANCWTPRVVGTPYNAVRLLEYALTVLAAGSHRRVGTGSSCCSYTELFPPPVTCDEARGHSPWLLYGTEEKYSTSLIAGDLYKRTFRPKRLLTGMALLDDLCPWC